MASQLDGIYLTDVGVVDENGARVGFHESVEAAEQCRLPRPTLADERDTFPDGDVERHARERFYDTGRCLVALDDIAGG
jgi:hypothetical protein